MAIDPKAGRVEGGWIYKYVSVGKLKSILNDLPDDSEVIPNRVGNLSVVVGSVKDGWTWRGYIDFAEETMIWD